MKLGYIGLGKMGYAMTLKLLEEGHEVVAYNRSREPVDQAKAAGAIPAYSYDELFHKLTPPRLIWIMVPHTAVDSVLQELESHLSAGDTVIDGGNSHYKKSMERYGSLTSRGIYFLDVGVSGGVYGARHGTCIMVGGERGIYDRYEELFRSISAHEGYGYMGTSGAGHFVKMVHNAIEYGMMQSIAEGFEVLKSSPFPLELVKIAELYNHNSVITSRLIGWLSDAYHSHGVGLESISGTVAATGEASWTVEAAHELGVPVPIIEESLAARARSHGAPSYGGKILSALRSEFGGHEVKEKRT